MSDEPLLNLRLKCGDKYVSVKSLAKMSYPFAAALFTSSWPVTWLCCWVRWILLTELAGGGREHLVPFHSI